LLLQTQTHALIEPFMPILKKYLIQRTFDLARLAMGKVSPNPIVGSVISTPNKIIGEGYHKKYGEAHAEVNALLSVRQNNSKKITESSISVSLEPCNFHGNTPACTDLIISKGIPRVNISTIDRTAKVNSAGLDKLKANGNEVSYGIIESKGRFVARVRNTFVTQNRPYIILKYAQSKDGFIGQQGNQIWLSNSYCKRLVHKWRSEVTAIMVGTNTVLVDNPELTTRLYSSKSPLRVIIDKSGQISPQAHVKNDKASSWIYTHKINQPKSKAIEYRQIKSDDTLLSQVCLDLYDNRCNTLLVEGGAKLLNSFISAGLWDEARIITSPNLLSHGIPAPPLEGHSISKFDMYTDVIELVINPNNVIYS